MIAIELLKKSPNIIASLKQEITDKKTLFKNTFNLLVQDSLSKMKYVAPGDLLNDTMRMIYISFLDIDISKSNKTNKHNYQASWKKIAMVFIEGDICEYYSRFIKKRYRVIINKPLRGGHISFINDSMKDLTHDGEISEEEVERLWEKVKAKWDGIEIPIVLDLNPRTNDEHWWLNVPHEERELLQSIRNFNTNRWRKSSDYSWNRNSQGI